MTISVQELGEATPHVEVVKPGVYTMPADQYHRDPVPGGSLSASGAKTLLNCPAKYKWGLDHPQPYKKAWDIGTAAHKLVLGEGPELVLVERPKWDTNEVKAEVAAIRAAGNVPLKADEFAKVHAMAQVMREHPDARSLLDPLGGEPEVSLFWQDATFKVWRRARLDWLPDAPVASGRMILCDYKTVVNASKTAVSKAIANYGYHIQAANYVDGVRAVHWPGDIAYLLIAQEKDEPYTVAVYQLDATAIEIGRQRMATALEWFRDCREVGIWPGYTNDVEMVGLPQWAEYAYLEEL